MKGVDGSVHGWDELCGPDGRAVCFAFLHPACPLAQEYGPVLGQLAANFKDDEIRFVGVVCDCDDPAEIETFRRTFGLTFPIHLDTDFALAEAVDATVTPQVVLVDRDRRIRYAGRIDDRYKIRGVMTPGDAEPELANAIQDLLAGREIREPRTKAAGCPIDRPDRPVAAAAEAAVDAPTFAKDVLPFLHTNCQKCHSPNQAGPFNLLSYDDAVEWVELAIEEIEARRMPPAQIESDLDYSWPKPPTAADLAMLRRWVAAAKPAGNPADTPPLEPLPDYSAFQEDLDPPTSSSNSRSRRGLGPTATTSTAISCFRSTGPRTCGCEQSSFCRAIARSSTMPSPATFPGRRRRRPCGSMAPARVSLIPTTGPVASGSPTASGFGRRPSALTDSRGPRS